MSSQAWVLAKLVQVIDFLGGLSLLKESTLSVELLLQPLRLADSISHYCKFLPKTLSLSLLIRNAGSRPELILSNNEFLQQKKKQLYFPTIRKPAVLGPKICVVLS